MDAQSYTAQERRAANQVWAAAGAYGFEPLFLARNTDGTIDFYKGVPACRLRNDTTV